MFCWLALWKKNSYRFCFLFVFGIDSLYGGEYIALLIYWQWPVLRPEASPETNDVFFLQFRYSGNRMQTFIYFLFPSSVRACSCFQISAERRQLGRYVPPFRTDLSCMHVCVRVCVCVEHGRRHFCSQTISVRPFVIRCEANVFIVINGIQKYRILSVVSLFLRWLCGGYGVLGC